MASIYKQIRSAVGGEQVWERLRDFYALHERLVPGFVVRCQVEPGARSITFENGLTVREALVSIDDEWQRLSYTVVGGKAVHHHASAQVFPESDGGCRLVWITDVLPDELAVGIEKMMDRGCSVMKATLEAR